jgi:hypothetical protein
MEVLNNITGGKEDSVSNVGISKMTVVEGAIIAEEFWWWRF